jgi:hypothetical protein
MSAFGTFRIYRWWRLKSSIGGRADVPFSQASLSLTPERKLWLCRLNIVSMLGQLSDRFPRAAIAFSVMADPRFVRPVGKRDFARSSLASEYGGAIDFNLLGSLTP